MKNRFPIVLLLLLLVLGCSKDSDDDNPNPTTVDKKANLKATGDSANDFLSNTNFDKLLIEIAYVQGFAPTSSAMTDFESFIKQHSFKTDIEITYKALSSPNEEKLTLDEIVELEQENRTVYNDGTTLALYIYFADAPSEDDVEEENLVTLGAVYLNTSMVIYEDTIRTLAGKSFVNISDVESATLNHEFGHLLGLVNLGTDAINDHESMTTDEDGNEIGDNHCNVNGCLMRAELQFGGSSGKNTLASKTTNENTIKTGCSLSGNSILQMLQQQATSKGILAAPDLDAECILDLRANGGR